MPKEIIVLGNQSYIGAKIIGKFKKLNYGLSITSYSRKTHGNLQDFLDSLNKGEVVINLLHSNDLDENRLLISSVINYCSKNNCHLIHFSSISVYDPLLKGDISTNSKLGGLFNYYSINKRLVEQLIFKSNVSYTNIRLGHVIEEGSLWFNKLTNVNTLELSYLGKNYSNTISTTEIFYHILKCLNDIDLNPNHSRIVNLVAEKNLTWLELLKKDFAGIEINKSRNFFSKQRCFSIIKYILYMLGFYKVKTRNRYPKDSYLNLSSSDYLALNTAFRVKP